MSRLYMGKYMIGNSSFLTLEVLIALIVVTLCFMIFFRTKEIYELTRHKGIHFFRNAFLFFGIAYIIRLIFSGFHLYHRTIHFVFPMRYFFPLMLIPISYLSTLAILALFFSTSWKKFPKVNNYYIHGAAIIISIISFIFQEPSFVILFQGILLTLTAIFSYQGKKTKKSKSLFTIYLLLFLFWFVSLSTLGTKLFLPREIALTGEIIGTFIFIVIYLKVKKWVK